MKILIHIFIITAAVLIAAALVPGIHISNFFSALIVAIVLSIINVTLKPVLVLLTLPINILTLGLFTFIINALLLWLAAAIVKGFWVDGFWAAFFGALIISLVHALMHRFERRPRTL